MAGDDAVSSTPVDRNLGRYTVTALTATWRTKARDLQKARVEYANEYLRAKIRKESDGTAHQIAIEATGAAITLLEADIDIIKALVYSKERMDA